MAAIHFVQLTSIEARAITRAGVRMLRFLVIAAVFAASLSGAAAIVGARGDAVGQLHTVLVTSRGQDCSGTLIARDLVLTAGHCVASGGDFTVNAGGVSIPVARIVLHPAFRTDTYQTRRPSPDMAILKLASPAPRPLRPARLAADRAFPPRGTAYVIAGYGEANEGDRRIGTLRAVRLISSGTTGGIMLRLTPLQNAGPAGSCTGDSGGSAYRSEDGRLVLHGVIAWAGGKDGRNCGIVTGIVLVSLQLDWIQATAKRLGSIIE
jgi:secreted trypsin-like serine protease